MVWGFICFPSSQPPTFINSWSWRKIFFNVLALLSWKGLWCSCVMPLVCIRALCGWRDCEKIAVHCKEWEKSLEMQFLCSAIFISVNHTCWNSLKGYKRLVRGCIISCSNMQDYSDTKRCMRRIRDHMHACGWSYASSKRLSTRNAGKFP